MNQIVDIYSWRRAMRLEHREYPGMPAAHRRALHNRLLVEELEELQTAMIEGDLPGMADALGDLIVVAVGCADEAGIPIMDVLDEIYRSNMSKLGANGEPIYREDGKLLKGPNYKAPNIESILWIE